MSCPTFGGATLSSNLSLFCIVLFSGLVRCHVGSVAISPLWQKRPAMKRLYPAVPTANITPRLCCDFLRLYKPRPDASGGTESRWRSQAGRNSDWKEFCPGEDRLP